MTDAASPSTFREVERKLRVHALFRLPDLSALSPAVAEVDEQPTRALTAVYHDTEDLRLFRWGVTLRRREGGDDEGWHLKLPVDGSSPGVRDEIRVPLAEAEVGNVPAAIAELVTAFVRRSPLVPVATLRTERTPYVLVDHDGTAVAELVDDVVSVLDGDRVAARFREIEVESLVAGDHEVLDDMVSALVEHGAVPGSSSKAAFAVGPRANAAPDVTEPAAVTPEDPAGDAVRAHLQTHVRQLLLQDVRVRRDLPDAVHQMRVAARRIRSGLKAFRPLLDEEWARALRDELGWLAGELGAVRDLEVLLARLDEHAAELDRVDADAARSAIDPALRERARVARAHALGALRSPRHVALLDRLVAAANTPPMSGEATQPCTEALPPLLDKAWRRLRKQVHDVDLDGPSAPWHQARIAAKGARYTAEALVPVFGKPAKRFAAAVEQVTEELGEHQDAAVAAEVLRDIAQSPDVDGRAGFALGLLHAEQEQRELLARMRFLKIWPDVRRVHRRTHLSR